MKDGNIVEQGPTHSVMYNPEHDYTKALLNAAPKPPARRNASLEEAD